MFMLNLLFDFSKKDGRFSETAPATPALQSSVHWLKLNNAAVAEPAFPPNPAVFNVESAPSWQDTGPRGTLLIPSFQVAAGAQDPANIAIRVAPDPATPAAQMPSAGATLELVVSFGRPTIAARTPQSSPFQDGTGAVQTTFHFGPTPRNTTSAWFFPLGVVARRPASNVGGAPVGQFLTDRYEYSIGIIVVDRGVNRHFGEDPEMDVGQ